MNSVQLIGRLTRDPEPARTVGGTAVTTFRLAIDRPGGGTDFVTVKTWKRLAETTAEHLRAGRRVAVNGRLQHEEWTDRHWRHAERHVVVADRVEFLDPPDSSSADPQPRGSTRAGTALSAGAGA